MLLSFSTKILCVLLIPTLLLNIPFEKANFVNAEVQVHSYAKWGRLAMQKTKEKYPNAAIVDYLHVGKVEGAKFSVEKFKLWLKEKDKEFGVLVDIKYNNETEQLLNITFKDVPN